MNRSYNAAESADIRDTIVPKQKDRLAAVSPNLLALLDVQTLSSFIHSALPKHKACTLVAGFEIHLRPEDSGPHVLIIHDLF